MLKALAVLLLCVLAACGGGGGDDIATHQVVSSSVVIAESAFENRGSAPVVTRINTTIHAMASGSGVFVETAWQRRQGQSVRAVTYAQAVVVQPGEVLAVRLWAGSEADGSISWRRDSVAVHVVP
jgi:hypothetical protein